MRDTGNPTFHEITLTPFASLRWPNVSAGDSPDNSAGTPWQERLFRLGAQRADALAPVPAFWSMLAAACVNALCHVTNPDTPSPTEADAVPDIPLPEAAASWLDSAPPMPGGEYLHGDSLRLVWEKLLLWCAGSIREKGGLAPFLREYAPDWRQVGRVFFHLAENRLDEARPFAFLATYTTGLNERGQPRHAPLSHALRRYAGENNRSALTRLLSPLQTASEKIAWVRAMASSGAIYHPTPWRPDQAYAFLCSAQMLEACGIGVRLPDWWKKRPRPVVQAELSPREESLLGLGALLDFDLSVALGEEKLSEQELAELLNTPHAGLALVKGQWVELDGDKLRQALAHWQNVKRAAAAGNLNFIQGMRLLAGLNLSDDEPDAGGDVIRQWSHLNAGAGFKTLLNAARGEELPSSGSIPGLKATLRPYQAYGVSWLRFLGKLGLGACLADDMGLGKTIQILALLLLEKQHELHANPSLLVVPSSLLANWKAESARFAPGLRLALLHPSEMRGDAMRSFSQPETLQSYDLIITTYAMCPRLPWLEEVTWRRVIADEAQLVKNAQTKQSRAVRRLKAPARIALTGTPIENSLRDLWTLFDFLNPGLLGSGKSFAALLKRLERSPERLAPLRRLTAPYILRRMKTDRKIIDTLPDKTEVPLHCHLGKKQAQIYTQITDRMKRALEELGDSAEDRNSRRFIVLQSLMLLKQVCNHPAQAGFLEDGDRAFAPEHSGKFQRVGELCADIASRQECALIFTQFREIIDPLAAYLAGIFGRPGLTLHGNVAVKKRGELVEDFQREDGPPFFILSLKAGGTGLTLTRAGHVIHFDRWWNPAVEDQATDRAFRIGQKKNVLVHKCVTLGTLEEKIDDLIARKRALAGEMLDGLEGNITAMNDEEILNLVRLDARRAVE